MFRKSLGSGSLSVVWWELTILFKDWRFLSFSLAALLFPSFSSQLWVSEEVSAFLTSYFLERQVTHPRRCHRQGLQIPLTEGKPENDGGVKRNSFAVFLHSTQGRAHRTHCPCWRASCPSKGTWVRGPLRAKHLNWVQADELVEEIRTCCLYLTARWLGISPSSCHHVRPHCSEVILTHSTNKSLCREWFLVACSVWTDSPVQEGKPTVGWTRGRWG